MRISRNSESSGRPLSTADLASAGRRPDVVADEEDKRIPDEEHAKIVAGRSTEPVLGRPAADEQLRTSQAEGDIETRRTDVRGTDRPAVSATRSGDEALVALFTPELTENYRSKWISIQSSFVDDPKQAVRSGDELVAQVMTNLANSFADERRKVEAQLDETGEGATENLRVAFCRYRSFFDRLLSL
jgi:hypothetical protein